MLNEFNLMSEQFIKYEEYKKFIIELKNDK